LGKNERKLLDELVLAVLKGGTQPPDKKQLRELAPNNKEGVAKLLDLAVAMGDLHPAGSDFYLHREVLANAKARIEANCAADGFTVSQMREWLQTTRKFAVPLAEYLDKIGFTRRQGDLRFLVAPVGAPDAVRR
jgi:selenocysteine-specific elongation factor